MKPLANIRVLELGRMYSAPWAGQLLADMGAEVIKVESPDGDLTRRGGHSAVKEPGGKTGDGATFVSVNRGKKSIIVDITRPEGQAVIRDLAARCDVFLENFKAGDLPRRGLGYDDIKAVNPKIVYLSLSGFGQTGPYASRPGMDTVVQAMSGYLDLTSVADGQPHMSPVVINDFSAGMYAYAGIVTALYHRDVHGGPGQYIDLSLLDAGIALMSFRLQASLLANHDLPRDVGATRFAPAGIYDTADGRLQISIGPAPDFARFAKALGLPDLPKDPRFATLDDRVANRVALDGYVIPAFRKHDLQTWLDRFSEASVMFSPLYTFKQMTEDPHIVQRDVFATIPHAAGGEITVIRNPLRMSETPIETYGSPPLLGAHTDAVLAEVLGLDADGVAALHASGAVFGRRDPSTR